MQNKNMEIMKQLMKILALCLLGWVNVPYINAQSVSKSATAGKEFCVAFLENGYGSPALQLKVVVEKQCNITARYNATNIYWNSWNNTLVSPGVYTFDLTYADMLGHVIGTSNRTLSITSTEDICVYAINYYDNCTDASTILPVSVWGAEYYLATGMSVSNSPDSYNSYAIVAKEDGTLVSLYNGSDISLQKNQVYYYFYGNSDLTGKKITATKPVAVYSGSSFAYGGGQAGSYCSTFGHASASADHCYEQLWSADKWGTDFFVWPADVTNAFGNWGGIMGIVAHEANTHITVSGGINSGAPLTYTLNAGDKQYVCDLMTGLTRVVSDKSVMVFTILPDAAITYIPPTAQRIEHAIVSPFVMTGATNIRNHSVEMLIPVAYWNQTVIRENGSIVTKSNYDVTTSTDFPEWYTVRRRLDNQTANITIDVYCPGGLLAYIYGAGNAETYGYLAGAGEYNLQCYFTIQERGTGIDAHYKNTSEVTHTFQKTDNNVTVKRTIEDVFTAVAWSINGVPYTIAENTNMMNTLTFPLSAFQLGENTLTMSVRFSGATQDSVYTGRLWLMDVNDDYAAVSCGSSVTVDVLANDEVAASCTPVVDIVSAPAHVTADVVDNKIVFRSSQPGLETVKYSVTCGTSVGEANVYIAVMPPLSQKYIACNGASVTVGFKPVAGITFYWYTVETDGTPSNTGNSKTITKNSSSVETWWVEPRSSTTTYPRIRVNLELGDCGVVDPHNCAKGGTVIFKEDFGGNDNTTPNISPVGIGNRSEYTYTNTLASHNGGNSIYTISKYVTKSGDGLNSAWHDIFDHTNPDVNLGYCMFVNGDTKTKTYELEIEDVCPNTELYFSLWLVNIVMAPKNLVKPDLEFVLFDKLTGDTISIYRTGTTINEETSLVWRQYGFKFTAPPSVTDIVFRIYSYGNGGNGNDYAIDDIEVRFCAPDVSLTQAATQIELCEGVSYTFEGNYTDNGTFGNNLVYRWEYNSTNDVNNPGAWTTIAGSQRTSNNGTVNSRYTVNDITSANAGHYRLAIGNAASIGSYNCRAMSDYVTLTISSVCASVVPLSQKYIACPGASVTMGFEPIAGITFYWYDLATNGTSISAGNTITVTKGSPSRESWWAEPQSSTTTYPRIRVDLDLGDCGVVDPQNCAKDGTVIFKEDFGGNDNTTPNVSPQGIGNKCEYPYTGNIADHNGGDNIYTIAKYATASQHGSNGAWHDIYDHTSPDDVNLGYCMYVNGKDKKKIYELDINNLCAGSSLYFSLWITNLLKPGPAHVDPDLEFVLTNKFTDDTVSLYRTGIINKETSLIWKMYGFTFDMPNSVTDITLKIYSHSEPGGGNDYAIDDIEVRLCAPDVSLTQAATRIELCEGVSQTFEGNYTDNGTFGNNLVYRWEYNSTNDVNNPGAWTPIAGAQGTSNNGTVVNSSYTVSNASTASAGHYRLAVGNAASIDSYNCRAMSDYVTLTVKPCAVDDYCTVSCDALPDTLDVLTNDVYPSDCTSPVVTVVSVSAHVTASVVDNKIVFSSSQSGLETVRYRVTCGTHSSEADVYVTVNGNAFVDDVWYFGRNSAGEGYKSPGIRFVKNANGEYEPQDASGESWVYSWENSLVVSSPYCDGQKIFYSSHNQLYNSLHDALKNGAFLGHWSTADGLAACYMGENKYLFFSITNADGPPSGLYAYIVDMNADNGKGERTTAQIIIEPETNRMSESIELISRAGTTDQYWLVYAYCGGSSCTNGPDSLRVQLVDVHDPDNPLITRYPGISKTVSKTYTMKISQQQNRIAIVNYTVRSVDIFDFDNATGTLSNKQTISASTRIFGVEFSPDGNQLYFADFTGNNNGGYLYQYDISGATPIQVTGSPVKYYSQTINLNSTGGGLKLGPDGKIYITQSYTDKVGVISNPDFTTSLGTRYNVDGLTLSVSYIGEQFSTGITKPAIMSCNMNNAPVTQADSALLCVTSTSRKATLNVLSNDTDIDASDAVFLTNAAFANPLDAGLADITVNAADSTITLEVKSGVYIGSNHVFEIVYDVKDNGLPASQCATGILKVTATPSPGYPDLRVRVCPEVLSVDLSKYIDTADRITSLRWTSRIPGIISPSGIVSMNNLRSSGVHTFGYTIQSQCATIEQHRTVYVEVLKSNRKLLPGDTIVLCYGYAQAVQINQIFGIEADGIFTYPNSVNPYIAASTNGAVVMNGKAIYENNAVPGVYRGDNVNIVDIVYTPPSGSCLTKPYYKVVIVLTGS
jgi:hypothetical protein